MVAAYRWNSAGYILGFHCVPLLCLPLPGVLLLCFQILEILVNLLTHNYQTSFTNRAGQSTESLTDFTMYFNDFGSVCWYYPFLFKVY